LFERRGERLLGTRAALGRELREIGSGLMTLGRRRRSKSLYAHGRLLRGKEVDRVAFFELNDGLLPVGTLADALAAALELARHGHRANRFDGHTVDGLNRITDLVLVRGLGDLERDLTQALLRAGGALGDDRTDQNLVGLHVTPPSLPHPW